MFVVDHCGHKFIKKIELANFFGTFLMQTHKNSNDLMQGVKSERIV